jgi:hypothetical protein
MFGFRSAAFAITERRLKILRDWCFEQHRFVDSRMVEAKSPGVQHLAGSGPLPAINGVTDHRMTKMVQMDADLMGAAAV